MVGPQPPETHGAWMETLTRHESEPLQDRDLRRIHPGAHDFSRPMRAECNNVYRNVHRIVRFMWDGVLTEAEVECMLKELQELTSEHREAVRRVKAQSVQTPPNPGTPPPDL